jgi:hypothetical protein
VSSDVLLTLDGSWRESAGGTGIVDESSNLGNIKNEVVPGMGTSNDVPAQQSSFAVL